APRSQTHSLRRTSNCPNRRRPRRCRNLRPTSGTLGDMVTSSGRSSSADDRSPRSRQPLWAAVRDDLESRIRSGDFSDAFPGELELSKQYGVSRSTIRAALTPLRRKGTVTAQPGRPSQVVNVSGEHAFGPIYSLFAAVRGAEMSQRSTIRIAEIATSPQAARKLELSKQYGVSRSTIRAALTPLRRKGTVTAQPGRPSQVVNVSGEHAFGPIYSLFAAVRGAEMSQRSTIRIAEIATSPQAARKL